MRPRHVALACLTLACLLGSARSAWADDRYFPFSYSYNTADQGEREFELYTDVGSVSGIENQLEFEYGVTDRFTLGVYGLLAQLHILNGFQVEGRYRLAEKGQWPVDTTLYAEYEDHFDEGPVLEGKLILEKSLGNWLVDANLIGEKPLSDEPFAFNGTLGAGYLFDDTYAAGLEARYDDQKLYAGPTFTALWGPTHLNAGVYYGGASEVLGRLVLAQEF
jgi:hypothetical protein